MTGGGLLFCARCRSDANGSTIVDGDGLAIAAHCHACHRVLSTRCLVCLRWFKNLAQHHRASECGRFHAAGMWWRAKRPEPKAIVKAPEQIGLFA